MADSFPHPTNSAPIVRKLTVRLLPFLFLLYIVAYIDRVNVGFAALQMQGQLGLNDSVYGFGSGIFFLGYFLFQVPSNRVLEKVGARRWMAVLLLTWGVISACMMFARGAHSFYVLRFLLGAAEAGFFPGMIFYLRSWFPAPARARAVAIFMTAGPMAGVIGGPVSGALLNLDRAFGLAGWQWMFLLEAAPAILLSGVVLFFLTETPHHASWLCQAEREWLVAKLESEQHQVPNTSVSLFEVMKIPAVWLLAIVYFGLNATTYSASFWLPNLIRSQSGMSSFRIGLLTAIPYVITAVVMVLVGLHSDRTGERRLHVAACAFIGAASLLVAAYSGSFLPMFLGIGLAVVACFSMCGPYWAMPTSLLPQALAATGIAFINSLGNSGGFFGPFLVGLMKTSTGAFKGGLLVLSALLVIAAVISVLLPRVTRKFLSPSPTATVV